MLILFSQVSTSCTCRSYKRLVHLPRPFSGSQMRGTSRKDQARACFRSADRHRPRPYREAHQVVADAELRAGFRRWACVMIAGRSIRLSTPPSDSAAKSPPVRGNGARRPGSLQYCRHHAPAGAHLALASSCWGWLAGPGSRSSDLRVLLQEFGDALRVLAVTPMQVQAFRPRSTRKASKGPEFRRRR